MEKQNYKKNLIRDSGLVFISILVAIIIAQTGILKNFLFSIKDYKVIGSFVAGAFWVSAFTVAPAAVVLLEIAKTNSIYLVAFFGSLGALFGDLFIFHIIKDDLSMDLKYVIKNSRFRKLAMLFKIKVIKWILSGLGALVIASPLPDDIGLTLMGVSRISMYLFVPLSFGLNFLGILATNFVVGKLI